MEQVYNENGELDTTKPMYNAVFYCQPRSIKKILEYGVPYQEYLFLSCKLSSYETASILLEHKANPNIINETFGVCNELNQILLL